MVLLSPDAEPAPGRTVSRLRPKEEAFRDDGGIEALLGVNGGFAGGAAGALALYSLLALWNMPMLGEVAVAKRPHPSPDDGNTYTWCWEGRRTGFKICASRDLVGRRTSRSTAECMRSRVALAGRVEVRLVGTRPVEEMLGRRGC